MLSPDFLRKLDNLRITAKQMFPGQMKGERRSPKRGASIEFADYRAYQRGDDIRHLDWNIYARLDKLFLKLFMEEENLNISILLDVSRSMDFGAPSKLEHAKRIAAAFGYVSLTNFDMVSICAFADTIRSRLPLAHGKGQILKVFNFLQKLKADGQTDFFRSLRQYAMSVSRSQSGVAIVISDFLDPQDYEKGLKQLRYYKFEGHIIHVLSDNELQPDVTGELRLEDAETGDVKEITVTDRIMSGYQQRLQSFCEELRHFCVAHGMTYTRVSTSLPVEEFILKSLRHSGIIH